MANEARSPAEETDGLKPAASLTDLVGVGRRKAALDLGPGSAIVPVAPDRRATSFAVRPEPPIATASFEILPPLGRVHTAEPTLMAADDMAALEQAVKYAESFGRRRPGPLPAAATLVTE